MSSSMLHGPCKPVDKQDDLCPSDFSKFGWFYPMVSSENSLDRLSSFKEDFYKDVTGVIKSRLFSI